MSYEDFIYSVVLGIVQGITESLPISSSAHLIVVSWFLKGAALPLSLNIALHVGTLMSVLIYFKNDWLGILRIIKELPQSRETKEFKLAAGLVLGTIPAGLVGVFFKDDIEHYLHHPQIVVYPLAIVGILLWLVDAKAPSRRNIDSAGIMDGFWVGIAQVFALIPGTSRSGATMIGGRLLGFDRSSAAKYSFLLGTPAMCGAALLEAKNIFSSLGDPIFYTGVLVSAIVGILTIHFLLHFVKKFGFFVFALYRVVVAIALFFFIS